MPPPSPWDFPLPRPVDDDLVTFGGDLQPGTLLAAYSRGLFPMPVSPPDPPKRNEIVGWWSPTARGVLPLDGLQVTRSLRQSTRHFEVRVDTAFSEVVAACADPRREHGWITPEIEAAYTELHRLGWAHSVEAWRDGELVGGLYGVAIGGLFAGESMFSHARDASKVALVALVSLLRDEHAAHRLLDTQWQTPHLARLGVVEIPRSDYLALLPEVLQTPLPSAFTDACASDGSSGGSSGD